MAVAWQHVNEKKNIYFTAFSLRIGVAGEYSKEAGGLLWKGKALEGNKQKLAGAFNEVARESSDLQCLMNILLYFQVLKVQ